MKLCKDCKHFQPDTKSWSSDELQIRYGLCLKGKINPVTGWPTTECFAMRSLPFFYCGTKAKWFEPKDAK